MLWQVYPTRSCLYNRFILSICNNCSVLFIFMLVLYFKLYPFRNLRVWNSRVRCYCPKNLNVALFRWTKDWYENEVGYPELLESKPISISWASSFKAIYHRSLCQMWPWGRLSALVEWWLINFEVSSSPNMLRH